MQFEMSFLERHDPKNLELSHGQHLAYNIVRLHVGCGSHHSEMPPQLKMIIQGAGGVGKSYLVHCLVKVTHNTHNQCSMCHCAVPEECGC
jgi:hypothetical protein